MSEATKKAILRALLDGVLTDLHPKTTGDQVYLDATTTLSAKLAELIVALNAKATTEAMNTALAGKAERTHGHEQSDVNGLEAALAAKASTTALNQAISALREEIMGDGVNTAYDTFTELAQYIAAHQDVADALNAAIGAKADKAAVDAIKAVTDALGSLANKNSVTEADLDAALKEKVNAASEGNHSHNNKALLDTYDQTNANIKAAIGKMHDHANKTVLDGITADTVAGWNGKSRVLVSSQVPSDLAAGDLLIQLTE